MWVKATMQFKAPLYYDDWLILGTCITRLGRSSIHLHVQAFRNEEDKASSSIELIRVYTRQAKESLEALPQDLRDRVQQVLIKDDVK